MSIFLLRRTAVISLHRRFGRPRHLDDSAMGGARFDAFLGGPRSAKGARPVRKVALHQAMFAPPCR
jgi:hypothetical protein